MALLEAADYNKTRWPGCRSYHPVLYRRLRGFLTRLNHWDTLIYKRLVAAHGSPEMADVAIKNQRTADEQLEVSRAIVSTLFIRHHTINTLDPDGDS